MYSTPACGENLVERARLTASLSGTTLNPSDNSAQGQDISSLEHYNPAAKPHSDNPLVTALVTQSTKGGRPAESAPLPEAVSYNESDQHCESQHEIFPNKEFPCAAP
jgi:hypothetical protein